MDKQALEKKYGISILSEEDELDIVTRIQNGEIARALLEASLVEVNGENLKTVLIAKNLSDYYDKKKTTFVGKSIADIKEMIADGTKTKNDFMENDRVPMMVISTLRAYAPRDLSFSELIQAGKIVYIRTVERFQYTRDLRVSNYFVWGSRQAVARMIAERADSK